MHDHLEIGETIGRYCIAMAMTAFGVQHVVYADFVTRLVPKLPAWIPGHSFLAYGFGFYLVVSGIALLRRKTARRTALLLGAIILVAVVLLYLPMVVEDSNNAGLWTNAGKALAMSGGVFLIAGSLPDDIRGSHSVFAHAIKLLERFIPLGRYFLGAFLGFCGVLHFVYVQFVAGLVPAWISGHVFWAYFSGVALIAGGLGIIVHRTARLAAALSALMVFLWVVMLHIPRAMTNLRDSNETTAVFEAIAITGTALLVATRQQRLARGSAYSPVLATRDSNVPTRCGEELARLQGALTPAKHNGEKNHL